MKKIVIGFSIAILSIVTISAIQMADNSNEQEESTQDTEPTLVPGYTIHSLPMPENLTFAGEAVPLDDPDIQERFDNELLSNVYFQSNAVKLIKKSKKYFPIIEPILKENGIPDDFKYLAVAESALTNAVSPAGARGFWQLMPATARELGMEVNDNVDERYDMVKSTVAATQYLKDSKKNFGTWTLAAAAYNAGNAGVNREQNRQESEEYYDLLLNQETARYVFRILALKEILEKPTAYGFDVDSAHLYTNVPVKKLKVDYEIDDLVAFAKANNISYKVLKIHNPWLRETKLNNKSGKTYYISIPEAGYYK
ncbi:Transglycosylase SLT domain-containing protein [Nonlabens sp. Hel1_33_55]|uniref:lytic transglycosylase domain-containing protein n=1 Tax=Nonlabens sp. Hel1_33_55 TaxID=1336802 RepID=UPI000875DC3E|nr:lytic transglycosylase domain-containing protein [Nonlabens sp. Hel1_33_55]SCX96289.1 Transglycosylase SLT domain-containing protein [Nonlabens sp. Hel1_33_55]